MLGRLADDCGALQVDRYYYHLERGERVRPDNAVFVIVLLDRGANDAGDADAVAAHFQHLLFTVLVEHAGTERFGVLGTQLEYVTNFNTARDRQRALAVRGRVTGHHVAQVDRGRQLEIAPEINTDEMLVDFVRAHDEVRQGRGGVVEKHGHLDTDGTGKTGFAAGRRNDVGSISHSEGGCYTGELLRLDCVQFMIAAQNQRDGAVGASHDQRFERLLGCHREHLAKLFDRACTGGCHLLEVARGCRAFSGEGQGRRRFNV